jgi:hypothetical protein
MAENKGTEDFGGISHDIKIAQNVPGLEKSTNKYYMQMCGLQVS